MGGEDLDSDWAVWLLTPLPAGSHQLTAGDTPRASSAPGSPWQTRRAPARRQQFGNHVAPACGEVWTHRQTAWCEPSPPPAWCAIPARARRPRRCGPYRAFVEDAFGAGERLVHAARVLAPGQGGSIASSTPPRYQSRRPGTVRQSKKSGTHRPCPPWPAARGGAGSRRCRCLSIPPARALRLPQDGHLRLGVGPAATSSHTARDADRPRPTLPLLVKASMRLPFSNHRLVALSSTRAAGAGRQGSRRASALPAARCPWSPRTMAASAARRGARRTGSRRKRSPAPASGCHLPGLHDTSRSRAAIRSAPRAAPGTR